MFDNIRLSAIIRESISDYAANAEVKAPSDWLKDYLVRQLANKSDEMLQNVSNEVIGTINSLEKINTSMKEAMEQGKSAESWMVSELVNDSGNNGTKAKTLAKCINSFALANADLNKLEPQNIIDTNSNENIWLDDNWNEYSLKDAAKQVAIECGNIGIEELGSEDFKGSIDIGIENTTDDLSVVDVLLNGMQSGLKVAVSAGLIVAEEKGIIPPTAVKAIATIAHRTIESLSIIKKVVRGQVSVTDALIHIKDTAVSTFCGIWKQCKNSIKDEIVDSVKNVFGNLGTVVSGIVTGLTTPKTEGSKLKNVIVNVGKAAIGFLKKEINIPLFDKIKKLVLS